MKNVLIRIAALMTAAMLAAPCALGEGGAMLGVTVRYTPAPTDAPADTAAPTSLPTPVIFAGGEATPSEAQTGSRILLRGMEGEDVAAVQQRLQELGYYLGDIDGIYGLKTRSAVYAFQRAHKLEKIDGKVGPETLGRMYAADAIVKPTPTPTPTPTPSPTPSPTPTPMPTPVPTPTPDAQQAPFAISQRVVTIEGKDVALMLGTDERGETLYPLCGVMSHMGYEYAAAAGSWQFTRARDGMQIALMTAGVDGLNPGAMGSYDGVIFLTDDTSRVYVYAGEAYVTQALLAQLGAQVHTEGGKTFIQ